MNKSRNWIVGLTLVSLMAVGVVALAGNGFGAKEAADWNPPKAAAGDCLHERDSDGDGILNSEDPDWVRPMDGSGFGKRGGRGGGQDRGLGDRAGLRDGSCR